MLSKRLERIISARLVKYLTDFDFFPPHQSAYHKGNSVETALTKVLADLIAPLDSGNFALQALLNLLTVYDTNDQDILLTRLETSNGITDNNILHG